MAQTLEEDMKDGEGQVKIGTTGTIGSLMMRELDQISDVPSKTQALPVSVTSQKQLQQRKSLDEASSSGMSSGNINVLNHRSSSNVPKTKLTNERHHHRIPMLGSESIQVEKSPIRKRNDKKKKSNIVEVVDIKCGHPDKAWSTPLTNSLKKLGFSKLSESII